ncbi:phosphoglucomutase/phosphomannomutase family protein [Gloeocapsa sp. PCC 73106]|uniref:phosphoglucomutase/phosphomannomutase family protein n=1 Tax=Gloeocapsa sp. PCC 73106 TaxID=102232 RepID=UPI0002ABFC16|nr:phosphoglucomutase/phosphomannomutase family protein [Gloeocapsa sp. PCC 73106]ELR98923.1 phosphomannomutase [Gloeocapsa sp. PCC 73106]
MPFTVNPIKFGTDGWRGIIAKDFTFERVARLAPVAARVLAEETKGKSPLIVIGYDRRFLADKFAKVAAESLQEAGFDVLLANSSAPTPALSWAAKQFNALGALVLTASHNPPEYLGLKVKGAFGGSVAPSVTRKIEVLLEDQPQIQAKTTGCLDLFDPWQGYCEVLRSKVDLFPIQAALESGKLQLFVDVMHGAAATGLTRLLGPGVREINSAVDPLFGGRAPEPLPSNLEELFHTIKTARAQSPESLIAGLIFDGDGDRIAAADGQGNFLSSQVLIPILIDHLAQRRGWTGEVVKTISGSDLIPRLAKLYNLNLFETPIGYKYIADRMLTTPVLIGGEESGGIGYGNHIPERDALLSALYVLEAVVQSGQDLAIYYSLLQEKVGFYSSYDRIDVPLSSLEAKENLKTKLIQEPPVLVAGQKVIDCLAIDGYKFRLEDQSWLLIRFSGTEPLLRLYSEAQNQETVNRILDWAKDWASLAT